MIKLWNVIRAPAVFSGDRMYRQHIAGMVLVYHRTKRSILKPPHIGMRTSHYPNVFNGTITLKG